MKLPLKFTACDIQNTKSEYKPATEAADETVQASDSENVEVVSPGLLTIGAAWTIGLSQRDSSGSDLVTAACDLWSSSNSYPTLLYRYCSLSLSKCFENESLLLCLPRTASMLFLKTRFPKLTTIIVYICLSCFRLARDISRTCIFVELF